MRPYRAKTKGKVELFTGYLKRSFIVPLKATLRSAGLKLDRGAANKHIGLWLMQTANARVYGTTGKVPNHQLRIEQEVFLPLPIRNGKSALPITAPTHSPVPVESLQHPLSVYDQLLEVSHEHAI